MSYVAAIKSALPAFEIEAATWYARRVPETLVVNHVSGNTLDKMVDTVVEHTMTRFINNRPKLTEFCVTTGFERNIKIRIVLNQFTILDPHNQDLYNSAIYYVIFMLAYVYENELTLTDEELRKWNETKNKIADGKLIVYY